MKTSIASALGEAAGTFAGAFEAARPGRRAEAVRRNLSVVLGRAPRPEEIRGVFATFGRSLASFYAAPAARGQADEIAGAIESDRLAPGVLLSGHLGAWELAATLLAARGVPMASVVRRMSSQNGAGAMDRWYDRLRGEVLPLPVERPRAVLRALAEGRTVAFAMDEPVAHGITADFFGEPTTFADGAFRLARIAKKPVFVGAGLWNDEGRLDVPILGPFPPEEPGLAIAALESLVRRAPTQWILFAPRW